VRSDRQILRAYIRTVHHHHQLHHITRTATAVRAFVWICVGGFANDHRGHRGHHHTPRCVANPIQPGAEGRPRWRWVGEDIPFPACLAFSLLPGLYPTALLEERSGEGEGQDDTVRTPPGAGSSRGFRCSAGGQIWRCGCG